MIPENEHITPENEQLTYLSVLNQQMSTHCVLIYTSFIIGIILTFVLCVGMFAAGFIIKFPNVGFAFLWFAGCIAAAIAMCSIGACLECYRKNSGPEEEEEKQIVNVRNLKPGGYGVQ